jgi:hypothetical protein
MSAFDPTSPNMSQTVAAMVASIFGNENSLNSTLTAHMADVTAAHGIGALLTTQSAYNAHVLNTTTAHGLATVLTNLGSVSSEILTARGSMSNLNARLSTALLLNGAINLASLNNKWLTIPGFTPTYVDATHFTVPGNWTGVAISGVQYQVTQSGGLIAYVPQTGASVYTAGSPGYTTITIDPAYPNLNAGLSVALVALIAFDNSVAAAETTLGTQLTSQQAQITALQVPFKPNYVTNPGMVVAQRPTAPALSGAAQFGQVDRWTAWASAGAVTAGTIAQDTNSPIGRRLLALKVAAATLTGAAVVSFRHRITAADAIALMGATVSFSAVVYQDTGVSINYVVVIRTATVADNFAGVNLISTSAAQPVPSATSAKIVDLAVVLPASAANGIEIEIQASTGAIVTKNLSLTETKLEEGPIATGFIYNDLEYDLSECYRYHREFGHQALYDQAGDGMCTTTSTAIIQIPFAYDMRAAPTMTYSAVGDWQILNAAGVGQACTALAAVANTTSKKAAALQATVAGTPLVAGNATLMQANNTTNARLIYDAELG